jgi:hypothetical protein
MWLFFRNIFIGKNFDRTLASILDLALPMPFPSQPSRSKAYTPLFLFSRSHGNPYQWITCQDSRPPSKEMDAYFWSFMKFQGWPSSNPPRRISQLKILPISSWNECGSTLGYHRPSSLTRTTISSTHFGRVSHLCWTPSSQNPLLSTPKTMTKHSLPIR